MTGEQRGLQRDDLANLQQQREDALHRHAEAVQARSRAKELVYQCQAQADSAAVDVAVLELQIDEALDQMNEEAAS